MVEDLIIGERGDDQNYLLYKPRGIAVDTGGRMFVLDSGNYRVQVFDTDGEYLRTLGSRGRGPGQLGRPTAIAIVADRVLVYDFGNLRLSVWSTDGVHLEDRRLEDRPLVREMAGTVSGELVWAQTIFEARSGSMAQAISRFSWADGQSVPLFELPPWTSPGPDDPIPIETVVPAFAVGGATIYATSGLEYQVVAFATTGHVRWALRVPWIRLPYPNSLVDLALRMLERGRPGIQRSDLLVPDSMRALAGLQVDGHGHLYVFLETGADAAGADQTSSAVAANTHAPVDVYSNDGQRLFTGVLTGGMWQAALGDLVYRLDVDRTTEEAVVVRYKLSESF